MNRFLLKQAIKAKALLQDKSGISETTEKLLWALGAVVVVGGCIIWAVAFMDKTMLPKLGDAIMDILNLKSGS